MLTLVDLPGYGHAVAEERKRKRWREATHSFLLGRGVLCLTCVLVDATRGLCDGDTDLLSLLHAHRKPHLVVLTKGDLLGPADLARAGALVDGDWAAVRAAVDRVQGGLVAAEAAAAARAEDEATAGAEASDAAEGSGCDRSGAAGATPGSAVLRLAPSTHVARAAVVSGHTGAGVSALWRSLLAAAKAVSASEGVPIHVSARK